MPPSSKTINRAKLKQDIDAIRKDLSVIDWSQIFDSRDLNKTVISFCFRLSQIISKHTNIITLKRRERAIKPWITPGLIRCMRHRDRLHMQARKYPDDILKRIIYTRYRNFCNNLLRKLKRQYDDVSLSTNLKNPKKMWRSIKDICHLTTKIQDPYELLNTEGAADAKVSLDKCNIYFSTVGQTLANSILHELQTDEKKLAAKVKPRHQILNSFFMTPTDEHEVENIIMSLQNDKAPGIDGLSNALLKEIKDVIISPLTTIFNQSLLTGVFPEQWKIACIKPIYKAGTKNSPQNYRPISLLTAFSKLLEKVVSNRLNNFIEANNLISSRQFGFRSGKSTEDAVTLFTSTIAGHLDHNKTSLAVFLDLSKAFDTVSIPILLEKLETQFGIRGVALDWFRSYLTERKHCIRVGAYE
ncbi:jg7919 [Pararge aegeria aegeria]|uniref:Jg7919 protein n=1 Tax=Pararge aegeria aegeria TaxID=348720 RepID=A0A8S4R3U5_9NEOP|nr:jg7919 [Pararge aegeria aegeria]